MSGNSNTDTVVRGFQCGGNDYIIKPCTAEEIQMRVGTQLRILDYAQKLTHLKEIQTINNMISTYNHEINNPLTIVLANIKKIKPQNEQEQTAMTKVVENLNRIADLVKNLKKVKHAIKKHESGDLSVYDLTSKEKKAG